ncbi:MAG TPA: site-specific DNA-methyltransferase [Polyangiaceae bacterium]
MPELLWKGKTRSRTLPRPRPLRTDEIHAAPGAPAPSGSPTSPWLDRLILGPAEAVLPSLLPELAGRVALVYLDPPFDTGGSFHYLARIPGSPEDAPRLAIPAYDDARGLDAWLTWFHATARLVDQLLAPGGGLYVHLDAHAAHYAKVLLDEVLGAAAFQREIVWRIGWVSGFKSRARAWIRNHDTLLFYAKGGRPSTFHKEYVPYPPGYARRDGSPPKGKGYPIDDVWNGNALDRLDSIQIVSFSGEKVGYPTQKNESLLARIVRASSSPGDIVLDACAGSGTTAVVASKLGRRWIACDASPVAVHAARKRLLGLKERGPFAVQSVEVAGEEGRLGARVRVDAKSGRRTVELTSFAPAVRRGKVAHWSQWIDGWCVDWESEEETLRPTTYVRRTKTGELALEATQTTQERARKGGPATKIRVKVFDIAGGSASKVLTVRG